MSEPRAPERPWWRPFPGAARLAGAAVVLFVHLALVFLDRPAAPRPLFGDEITYRAAAGRLLAFGAADLDPLWPPLYPYFLAPLLALGGGGLFWVRAAQLALLGLSAFLLGDLAKRWSGRPEVGAVAAFLLLADPQVAAFAHYLWPEVLHLALFLAALRLLVQAGEAASRRAWMWAACAGLALGLALLAKTLLLPFLPLLLAPLALSTLSTLSAPPGSPAPLEKRGPCRRGLLAAGLALLVAAAVVAPAVWTNHRRGHGWVIADSSRFNLWVGLNDTSRRNLVGEIVGDEYARYQASAAMLPERNRILSAKIHALVEERGWPALLAAQLERQPFRLFDKDSFFTDQLPGGAISALGFGYRDVPPALAAVLRGGCYLFYGAVLALAGWGLFLVNCCGCGRGRDAGPWWRVLLAFLAGNLLLFLFFHVKTRYRVQILPVLDLYAAVAVAFWTGRRGAAVRERLGAVGWTGAALVSAALLYWAFGS